MAEYQITLWRDIPSMVVAREGDSVTKIQLAARLQEAIDEAAMRLGDVGSNDYLAGWTKSQWATTDGDHADVATAVAQRLEGNWTASKIAAYLKGLG